LTIVSAPQKELVTPSPRNFIVNERFSLSPQFKEGLSKQEPPWGFGALSEAVYFRTYSRMRDDGRQEHWADTVIRVVEGVMSIRKDWYKNVLGKRWDEKHYQKLAQHLASLIFQMKILPPGRGLWAMGTDYVFERGSHSLNNCGFVEVSDSLSSAASWLMDSLMCGVGVGFSTHSQKIGEYKKPTGEVLYYSIPDSREGWVESLRALISSYELGAREIKFDYSQIRPTGVPLRGFGGVSAGAAPLITAHERIRSYLDSYAYGETSATRLISDVMNAIGACVVAGNIRRSAEIALGSPTDTEFLNLKNYNLYPERSEIGWMSNNSVVLTERSHFAVMPDIAKLVQSNGEPGILNMLNISKYGRIGDRMPDQAVGINPCGESPLESYELCNLVEVFPTRCASAEEVWDAMKYATFYASTVSLLRSHSAETNEVVARNRRIGVSVSGIADWIDTTSVAYVFQVLNKGYEDVVRPTNTRLAREAGVPASIRVTTVKPSGSISLLAGVSSGMHHPLDGYVLRRMRVSKNSPVAEILEGNGIPHEPDVNEPDFTEVFEFPLKYGNGRTRSVKKVSIYEQAAIVAMLQKSWADNAVSNTLTVQPHEFPQIERVLSFFAPQVKSLSLLPDVEVGAYPQMPLEKITKDEFEKRSKLIGKGIDWSSLTGTDGVDSRFCTNDSCEI